MSKYEIFFTPSYKKSFAMLFLFVVWKKKYSALIELHPFPWSWNPRLTATLAILRDLQPLQRPFWFLWYFMNNCKKKAQMIPRGYSVKKADHLLSEENRSLANQEDRCWCSCLFEGHCANTFLRKGSGEEGPIEEGCWDLYNRQGVACETLPGLATSSDFSVKQNSSMTSSLDINRYPFFSLSSQWPTWPVSWRSFSSFLLFSGDAGSPSLSFSQKMFFFLPQFCFSLL